MRRNPDQENFRQLKQLERTVEKIDRDVESVIVEGFSDREALKKLGFTGKIFMSAERTVEDIAEDVELGSTTVAVLTDFDSHGKNQNKKLSQELQSRDVKVDFAARRDFGNLLTGQGRHDVEDVKPLFSSWQDKYVDAMLDRLFF